MLLPWSHIAYFILHRICISWKGISQLFCYEWFLTSDANFRTDWPNRKFSTASKSVSKLAPLWRLPSNLSLQTLQCRHDDRCECSDNTTGRDLNTFSGFERDFNPRLCVIGAMLSQLSYQSHMREVVCGLALYFQWTYYSDVILGSRLITQLINYLLYSPPTQHNSSFKNLLPLFMTDKMVSALFAPI